MRALNSELQRYLILPVMSFFFRRLAPKVLCFNMDAYARWASMQAILTPRCWSNAIAPESVGVDVETTWEDDMRRRTGQWGTKPSTFWLIIQVPLAAICFAALDITGNLSDLLIFVVRDSDVSRHTNRHQHDTPHFLQSQCLIFRSFVTRITSPSYQGQHLSAG